MDPCAEEILPVIVFGSLPGDFQVADLPTNSVADSLVSTFGISRRKCLGLNVFRPLRNWITFAIVIVLRVKVLFLKIWFECAWVGIVYDSRCFVISLSLEWNSVSIALSPFLPSRVKKSVP